MCPSCSWVEMPRTKAGEKAPKLKFGDAEKDMLFLAMSEHGRDFGAIRNDKKYAQLAVFPDSIIVNAYSRMITRKDERFCSLHERLSSMSTQSTPKHFAYVAGSGLSPKKRSIPQRLKEAEAPAAIEYPITKKQERFNFPVKEIIDVEACWDAESRKINAQYNTQLSSGRRHWVPREAFYVEDAEALRDFISKLRMKLQVAEEELERLGGPNAPALPMRDPTQVKKTTNPKRKSTKGRRAREAVISEDEEEREASVSKESEGIVSVAEEESESGSILELPSEESEDLEFSSDGEQEAKLDSEQESDEASEEDSMEESEAESEAKSIDTVDLDELPAALHLSSSEEEQEEDLADHQQELANVPDYGPAMEDDNRFVTQAAGPFNTQALPVSIESEPVVDSENKAPKENIVLPMENPERPTKRSVAIMKKGAAEAETETDSRQAKKQRLANSLREARANSSTTNDVCSIM